jgi:hypothetical protein
MRRSTWSSAKIVAAVVLGLASLAPRAAAAGWADGLFTELAHDFGPVPRGAKVRHAFAFTNRLAEPITVLDVRASCGCTTGAASTRVVAPGQSAVVEAEMDTRNFVGRKATVLYVSFATSGGRESEVRLGVSSTILSDVVLNPGSIDFGLVTRGETPTLSLTIDRLDAPGWRVQRMVSACKAIDATLTETARDGRSVSYLLKVSMLPQAVAGAVRDEIRLMTNDAETPVFSVPVTATIRGDLTASPAVLSLGVAPSSGGAQGRYLLRASKPFTVRAVEGQNEGFHVTVDDQTAKAVHILTVSFRPEESTLRGDLRHSFRVHTDLPGEAPADLTATIRAEP